MSETPKDTPNNVIPIEQAPSKVLEDRDALMSAVDVPVEAAPVQPDAQTPETAVYEAGDEAQSPDRNVAQAILTEIGGEPREGEAAEDVRRRGLVRIGGTIATGAMLVGGVQAATAVANEYQQDQEQKNVQIMKDFKKDGALDEGKIVIEADRPTTAWNLSDQITSGEDQSKLIDVVSDQADAQGFPGVETGELFVVDEKLVDPNSAYVSNQQVK